MFKYQHRFGVRQRCFPATLDRPNTLLFRALAFYLPTRICTHRQIFAIDVLSQWSSADFLSEVNQVQTNLFRPSRIWGGDLEGIGAWHFRLAVFHMMHVIQIPNPDRKSGGGVSTATIVLVQLAEESCCSSFSRIIAFHYLSLPYLS